MGTMTDDEVAAKYIATFGNERDMKADPYWRAGCVKATRAALEAKTIDDAVESLRRDGWGDPVEAAMRLRGVKKRPPCPHCNGTGELIA